MRLIFASVLLLATMQVGASVITIDGDRSDWTGVSRLINDPSGDVLQDCGVGDCRADTVGIRVTHDSDYIYLLYEFANDWGVEGAFLWLDTDLDSSTGCTSSSMLGIGAEYGISFDDDVGDPQGMGDARNCSFGFEYSSSLNWESGSDFIEASVLISTLEILTPDLIGFGIVTHNDLSGPGRYLFDSGHVPFPSPVPAPPAILLFGIGLAGLIAFTRRRKAA